MNSPALRVGALRALGIAGGFTLGSVVLGAAPLPGPVLAAGMLALPCALFAVLRRQDRRLARTLIFPGGHIAEFVVVALCFSIRCLILLAKVPPAGLVALLHNF